MKKIIFLVMMILMLSGCTIEYNLKIDEDSFTEKVNIITPISDEMSEQVDRLYTTNQVSYIGSSLTDKHYYDLSVNEVEDNYNLEYSYKFPDDTILKSSAITQCYNNVDLKREDTTITISTDQVFNCLYRDGAQLIEAANINITSPLRVVSNNADKVNNGKYTWTINKDNYKNKPIKIKLSTARTAKEQANEAINKINKNVPNIEIIIISIILIIIAIILYFFIKRKENNNNQF